VLKRRSFVFLMLALVTVLILVGYWYAVFSHAKVGDAVGGALSGHITKRVPNLRIRQEPTQDLKGAIAFGAVGWGSEGACSYMGLQRCIALQVDAGIAAYPQVMQALIESLVDVCSTLPGALLTESHPIAHYFGCATDRRRPVRIQLNVVEGLAIPAVAIPLPDGGKTYARDKGAIRYQVVIDDQATSK
jgi:hypothetical protein